MSDFVTVKEAAKATGVTVSALRYHITKGHLAVERRMVTQQVITERKEIQDHVDLDRVKRIVKQGRHR